MSAIRKLSDSRLLDKSTLTHLLALDDGEGFLQTITSTFYNDAENLLAEIKTAIEMQNYDALLEAIHGLKGCASNLGATSLKKLCLDYDDLAPTALMERRFEVVLELSALFHSTRHALDIFIEKHLAVEA